MPDPSFPDDRDEDYFWVLKEIEQLASNKVADDYKMKVKMDLDHEDTKELLSEDGIFGASVGPSVSGMGEAGMNAFENMLGQLTDGQVKRGSKGRKDKHADKGKDDPKTGQAEEVKALCLYSVHSNNISYLWHVLPQPISLRSISSRCMVLIFSNRLHLILS